MLEDLLEFDMTLVYAPVWEVTIRSVKEHCHVDIIIHHVAFRYVFDNDGNCRWNCVHAHVGTRHAWETVA
jgi:hypothetical protein